MSGTVFVVELKRVGCPHEQAGRPHKTATEAERCYDRHGWPYFVGEKMRP